MSSSHANKVTVTRFSSAHHNGLLLLFSQVFSARTELLPGTKAKGGGGTGAALASQLAFLVLAMLESGDGYKKNKQTNKQTDKQTDKQTNKQTNRQTDRQTNKQTDRQTNKQTDRQTNKQTNKQTDR